jgi:hypothetical protein
MSSRPARRAAAHGDYGGISSEQPELTKKSPADCRRRRSTPRADRRRGPKSTLRSILNHPRGAVEHANRNSNKKNQRFDIPGSSHQVKTGQCQGSPIWISVIVKEGTHVCYPWRSRPTGTHCLAALDSSTTPRSIDSLQMRRRQRRRMRARFMCPGGRERCEAKRAGFSPRADPCFNSGLHSQRGSS